jgi:hypothetical protein
MAKRRRQKVNHSLLSSCGISTITHVILLTILSISFSTISKQHPIKLNVDVLEVEDILDNEIVLPNLTDLKLEDTQNDTSKENIPDIEASLNDSVVIEDIQPDDKSLIVEPAVFHSGLNDNVLPDKVLKTEPQKVSGAPKKAVVAKGFDEITKNRIDKKLIDYNAGTGDIQISISWEDYNDIDVWVHYIGSNKFDMIGWQNKFGSSGGILDIDRNVTPTTTSPVENIFWPKDKAPYGRYIVYIHHYQQWDKNKSSTVYLRVKIDDNIIYKKLNIVYGYNMLKAYEFIR